MSSKYTKNITATCYEFKKTLKFSWDLEPFIFLISLLIFSFISHDQTYIYIYLFYESRDHKSIIYNEFQIHQKYNCNLLCVEKNFKIFLGLGKVHILNFFINIVIYIPLIRLRIMYRRVISPERYQFVCQCMVKL